MKITIKERLPGILLTLVGIVLLWHTFDDRYADTLVGLQFGPVFFPQLILGCWLVLSTSSIFFVPAAVRAEFQSPRRHGKAVLLALLLLAYLLSLDILGFLLATFIVGILSQLLLGYRHKARLVLWSALISAACWATFEFAVGIPLPAPTFL